MLPCSNKNMLSSDALKNIYEMTAVNLKKANERLDSVLPISPQK